MNTDKRMDKKKWHVWLKRYLLAGGIALIGVPIWEFFLEEFTFKEIDLFFPGDSDVLIGGVHIGVLGIFHLITKGLRIH
jgi:hypothetical protein